MAYVVETPNIQLDARDITLITANLTSVGGGYPVDGPNIQLDKYDLAVLNTQVTGSKGAVQTENITLSAQDVALIATATGH